MHDERAGECVVVNYIAADGNGSLACLLLWFELFGVWRLGLGRFGLGSFLFCLGKNNWERKGEGCDG
jgi:hypothetical protein